MASASILLALVGLVMILSVKASREWPLSVSDSKMQDKKLLQSGRFHIGGVSDSQLSGRKLLQSGRYRTKTYGYVSAALHFRCPNNDCGSHSPPESFAASDRLVPSGPDPLHHRIRIHN